MAVVDTTQLSTGPGAIWWAPLGTPEPTHVVTASAFSDAITVPWIPIGATRNGMQFDYTIKAAAIYVEELLDPAKWVTEGREGAVKFDMAQVNPSNFKRALNGGTITTIGAAGTTMTTLSPATIGSEVRGMLLWMADDLMERYVFYQCFQSGTISIKRQKGAAYASLPVDFKLEIPPSGLPFKYITAGANLL